MEGKEGAVGRPTRREGPLALRVGLQDGELATGEHRRVWNAADYATGVYFYRLAMNGTVETQKLVLAR